MEAIEIGCSFKSVSSYLLLSNYFLLNGFSLDSNIVDLMTTLSSSVYLILSSAIWSLILLYTITPELLVLPVLLWFFFF